MLLEICVDSLPSAQAAIAGGADRLELCSALLAGGLTPSPALLRQIRRESNIPIRCLIRCRAGDFLYDAQEIRRMHDQILELKDAGADGFVIGCLQPDGQLDLQAMEKLMDAAGNTNLTLHRAIDVSKNPAETYLACARLGLDTVLTSGAAANCKLGAAVIADLLRLRDEIHGPDIMIGAGVNAQVIRHFRQTLRQARTFHMSGKIEVESRMVFRREGVPMGLPGLDEWHIQQTDLHAVREAKAALQE